MLSWTHILVIVVIVMLLFGGARISTLMGDVAKGVKSFKKGLAEDEKPANISNPGVIENNAMGHTKDSDKDRAAHD